MVSVLETVEDRATESLSDQASYAEDGEIDQEENEEEDFAAFEEIPQQLTFEAGSDTLDLYFSEVGRTPLLNDEEVKGLARQIEQGKHLARLEKEWATGHNADPSAVDLVILLMERLARASSLFDAIHQYLKLPPYGTIEEKILHAELRSAIDDRIDQHLSDAVAEITGSDQASIGKSIVELSLDSRLLPWSTVDEFGRSGSLADFGELLHLTELREKLEAHRSRIAEHFERIRERAHEATNHMIQANLRLAVSVAKGHGGWGVPLPDLIQEGNIGLMQAVRKFDHRRGWKFSTYAIPWIWQAVNRAVTDKSRMVRLPGHVVDNLTKLTKARTRLAQELGRQPTEEELTDETKLPSKKIRSLLEMIAGGTVSLDAPVGEDGSRLGDLIADQTVVQPEDHATASFLREELNRTLESLTPRERRVIELRFGLDDERSRTLGEVGTELGLTKERIRQIEREALTKLRHPAHSRKLVGYLE